MLFKELGFSEIWTFLAFLRDLDSWFWFGSGFSLGFPWDLDSWFWSGFGFSFGFLWDLDLLVLVFRWIFGFGFSGGFGFLNFQ